MNEVWVCAGCRSINRPTSDRCYHCGTAKSEAARVPMVGAAGEGLWAPGAGPVPANVQEAFTRYRSAGLRASLTVGFIVAVTVLELVTLLFQLQLALAPSRAGPVVAGLDPAVAAQPLLLPVMVASGIGWIAGGICWLAWFRRAVANVPRLGAGPPPASPLGAIGWWFVPIVNLLKPYRIVHDLYRRITVSGSPSPSIVTWWWLALTGSSLVETCGVSVRLLATSARPGTAASASALDLALTALSAILTVVAGLLAVRLVRAIQHGEDTRAMEIAGSQLPFTYRGSAMSPPGGESAPPAPRRRRVLAAVLVMLVLGLAAAGGFAAMAGVNQVLAEQASSAPGGWTRPVCAAAREVERAAGAFRLRRGTNPGVVERQARAAEASFTRAGQGLARAPVWRPGQQLRTTFTSAVEAGRRGFAYLGRAARSGRTADGKQAQAWLRLAESRFRTMERDVKALERAHGRLPCDVTGAG